MNVATFIKQFRKILLIGILSGYYSLLLMIFVFPEVALSQPTVDLQAINNCQDISAAYNSNHDAEIQRILRQKYRNNACFKEQEIKKGNLLSDNTIGKVTKTWILQYLKQAVDPECATAESSCHGSPEKLETASSEEGIRPFMITQDDLVFFQSNTAVYQLLQEKQGEAFISKPALVEAIVTELQSIKGITENLQKYYLNLLPPYIKAVTQYSLGHRTIELLNDHGLILAAKTLENLVGKKFPEKNLDKLIENLLNDAYLQRSKMTAITISNPPQSESAEPPSGSAVNQDSMLTISAGDRKEIIEAIKIVKQFRESSQMYQLKELGYIETELPSIADDIASCIQNLVDTPFYGKQALKESLSDILNKLSRQQSAQNVNHFNCQIAPSGEGVQKLTPDAIQHIIEMLMKKTAKPFFANNLQPVKIAPAAGCQDCSQPMKGVSYGFYPFWEASDAYQQSGVTAINPALIDFSIFERIAYFALPISEQGKISSELHWSHKNQIKDFVQVLSKYNVKRDLVLYTNNWQNWGSGGSQVNIDQTVIGFADQNLQQIIQLHNRVEEFGGISGITVFFDGYKNDSDPANIISYIKHLIKKIAEDNAINFDVNLILGIKWGENSCAAVNTSARLETYFKDIEELLIDKQLDTVNDHSSLIKTVKEAFTVKSQKLGSTVINKLLVFLDEPSSRAKKCLRLQIENEFHGADRVDVLRKVIPVLGRAELREKIGSEPENDNFQFAQFEDDMSYLKDNFGGIGMWPVPIQRADKQSAIVESDLPQTQDIIDNPVMTSMSSFLKQDYIDPYKNYMDFQRLGYVGEFLHQPQITEFLSICSWVCPNRISFKYFILLISLVSVVSFTAFRVSCKAQKFIIKIKYLDIAIKIITVLSILSILGCDPEWQPVADLILSITALLFIGYFIYQYFFCGYETQNDNE